MRWFIIMMFLPVLAFAQDFQFHRELDSVQVMISDYTLPAAWTGGYVRSIPDFCDIDGDGLLDLMLGSSNGQIAFYKNIGTPQQARFKLETPTFQGINLYPYNFLIFWDMDADGDLDLFDYGYAAGGGMRVYKNIGSPTTPQFILVDSLLRDTQGNPIGGTQAALCDIDGDGDKDLFIGTFDYGQLKYYQNVGDSVHYAFSLVTTSYFGIATGSWCAPTFCDIDGDGDYDLFIGDRYGHIWFYRNDGTPQQPNFIFVTNNWLGIDVGDYASPEFADTDGDGDYDLWVGRDVYDAGPGNTPGDVFYYQNIGTSRNPQFQLVRTSNLTLDSGLLNVPLLRDLNGDGKLDLLYSNQDHLSYYQNIGSTTTPIFSLVTNDLLSGQPPHSFALYDLNGDGLLDLICSIGSIGSGQIKFYRNQGSFQSPNFVYWYTLQTLYEVIGQVTLADMDHDGDGDMVVSHWYDSPPPDGMAYYRNDGTSRHPNFVLQTGNWQNLPGGRNARLVDMDGDGRIDLLCGYNDSGYVEYYHNIGTPQNPQLVLASSNLCGMPITGPFPTAGDLDGDGDMDLLVGQYDGGILFFRNVTGQSPVHPNPKRPVGPPERQITILPNPGNSGTTISYVLSHPQHVNLAVYNILGSRLATLVDGLQQPGEHVTSWDATWRSSGIYLVRLESPDFTATQKVVIAK